MKRIVAWAGAAGLAAVLATWGAGCATTPEEEVSDFERLQTPGLFSVRYEAARQVLIVVLPNGDVYDYEGVPADLYDGLLKAPSKDEFFAERIRDRFKGTKVEL
jgi:hypothetical protein